MSEVHAHTVSFVRREMLPEQDPPLTESGAIKWLRENLFSSWMNAILTIVSLYVVYWVLAHILPWMLGGIWDAGSLRECREIRDALYGEGASVACWAVLTDRWNQLLFGFYPSEAYWRPIVALLIFLGGIAPVLFSSLPRQSLWFTAAAPFLMFFFLCDVSCFCSRSWKRMNYSPPPSG